MDSIIFYGTPAYGHINPTLPIVNELVKRKYRVIYYATPEFKTVIENCGGEFKAYDFGDIEWEPQVGSRILQLTSLILKISNDKLDTMLEQVREIKPVLILHDTIALWGRLTAKIMGVRAVSINPIITIYPYTHKTFRMYINRFIGTSIGDLTELSTINRYKRNLTSKYNLERQSFIQLLMNEEEFNIFTYPRVMHPEGKRLGDNCFFLGASAILRNDDYSNEEYPYENLIYVSMGTIFNDNINLYRNIMKYFAGTEYTVVISCEKYYDRLTTEAASNIIIRKYVNQKQIMKKAVLFITAGGMNSICEAAVNSVPCLIYPQQGEQDINAQVFNKLGLGHIIHSERNLPDKVRKLLADFKENPDLVKEFSTIRMEELINIIEQ